MSFGFPDTLIFGWPLLWGQHRPHASFANTRHILLHSEVLESIEYGQHIVMQFALDQPECSNLTLWQLPDLPAVCSLVNCFELFVVNFTS